MPSILGIDTSNYTTSAALFDTDTKEVKECRKLLPVKPRERGIRQSDAVFHHVRQLPQMLEELRDKNSGSALKPDIVCCSVSPTGEDGSYMPCFLAGVSAAKAIKVSSGCEYIETTHQAGHIYAALYSAGKLDLLKSKKRFISFHVSGGTTDCLLCSPGDNGIKITTLCRSLDLKAGQAVDRVGLMLGLDFPCGIELEKLAQKSDKPHKTHVYVKNGSCSLSGVENKCADMLRRGELPCDIALFCLEYIYTAIREMTKYQLDALGAMPVVYAGGVMSDKLIANKLSGDFDDVYFAAPEFSRDNALGVCVAAAHIKGLI